MTQQRLHSALAPLDVLTRIELEESLTQGFEQAERARIRGIDYMEVNGNGNAAANVTVPGADSGYAWSLKIVSFVCSAACTANVYMGENANSAPIGTIVLTGAGPAIFTYTSNIAIVRDARAVFLTVSAGGINAWKVIAKQVPNEMIGKL